MVLAAPHHKTAAKAHDAFFDVDHPRFPPRFVQPVPRPLAIELLDVRAQEPARVPPAPTAERITGRRHQGARIKPPTRTPHRVWRHGKIEACHTTARTQ